MPKPAGVTFNRYAAIAGQTLRRALKEEVRAASAVKDALDVRYQKWENGVASESNPLNVNLKQ